MASFGRCNKDEVDGHDKDAEDVHGVDGDVEGDVHDDGYEKIMWERDGVGYKSMPMSLAILVSLYVSVTSSLFGKNKSRGIFVFVFLALVFVVSVLLSLLVSL